MALVADFIEGPRGKGRVHPTETDCTYEIATVDGKTYLTLKTGGSSDRKFPGKVSQSLQLDERSAAYLMGILKRAFPSIS